MPWPLNPHPVLLPPTWPLLLAWFRGCRRGKGGSGHHCAAAIQRCWYTHPRPAGLPGCPGPPAGAWNPRTLCFCCGCERTDQLPGCSAAEHGAVKVLRLHTCSVQRSVVWRWRRRLRHSRSRRGRADSGPRPPSRQAPPRLLANNQPQAPLWSKPATNRRDASRHPRQPLLPRAPSRRSRRHARFAASTYLSAACSSG